MIFTHRKLSRGNGERSENIARLKEEIDSADAIVIGTGACLNFNEACAPEDIVEQSIILDGDVGEIISHL